MLAVDFALSIEKVVWVIAASICLAAAVLAASTRSLRQLPAEAGWVDHAERHALSG